jgi:hypothetical protein
MDELPNARPAQTKKQRKLVIKRYTSNWLLRSLSGLSTRSETEWNTRYAPHTDYAPKEVFRRMPDRHGQKPTFVLSLKERRQPSRTLVCDGAIMKHPLKTCGVNGFTKVFSLD